MNEHLLDSLQMARFAAHGVLRFDQLVSDELNAVVHAEMAEGSPARLPYGTPLSDCFPAPSAIGAVIRLPQIQGIIESLVGPNSLYDHHNLHVLPPKQESAQIIHGDGIIDTRIHFDIQLFYFPHDVPSEMGGSMVVPGSHFRRINYATIGRYQNFLGQMKMEGKAGTVFVLHHGIWHCARRNETDCTRYMFKLRLNPQLRQERLWDTSDIDQPGGKGEAVRSEVIRIFNQHEPWFDLADGQLDVVNRIKFWRFLTGDPTFDANYWLTRIENMPEAVAG